MTCVKEREREEEILRGERERRGEVELKIGVFF